jgi:hypothetical protein
VTRREFLKSVFRKGAATGAALAMGHPVIESMMTRKGTWWLGEYLDEIWHFFFR